MSFFGSLTGSSQRKDLKRGYRDASRYLKEGFESARGELGTGYSDADRFLSRAHDSLSAARGDLDSGERAALGHLDPYLQSGAGGLRLYDDALGINGLDAQRAFGQHYAAHDPFRQQNADFATEDLMRALNARGLSGSGYGAEAVAQQSLRRGSEDYQNYLNRLAGLRDSGQGAATTAAGIRSNFSTQRAGLRDGQSDIYGQRAQTAERRGNALSELIYGNAQQKGQMRMGYADNMANARGIGLNNMLQIAGTAAKFVMPTG